MSMIHWAYICCHHPARPDDPEDILDSPIESGNDRRSREGCQGKGEEKQDVSEYGRNGEHL